MKALKNKLIIIIRVQIGIICFKTNPAFHIFDIFELKIIYVTKYTEACILLGYL